MTYDDEDEITDTVWLHQNVNNFDADVNEPFISNKQAREAINTLISKVVMILGIHHQFIVKTWKNSC